MFKWFIDIKIMNKIFWMVVSMTNSKKIEIKGVIPPIITSFTRNGEVYEEGQRAVVSFLNKYVDGYFVCGTYGSGPLMTTEERKKVLEIVIDETPENKFVIAHVGAPATSVCVELAKHAEDVGADAVAAVPPYYYRHRETEVKNHYRILRENVDIPIFIYNNPKTSGFSVTPQFLAELIDEGLIDGIKDSSFDIITFSSFVRKTESVRKAKKQDFIFIIGTEALMLPGMLMGAKGAISGLANCIPEDVVALYKAIEEGDISKAVSLQMRVLEERDIMHLAPAISCVHAILRIRGIDAGYPRAPFQEVDDTTFNKIKESLERMGIEPI